MTYITYLRIYVRGYGFLSFTRSMGKSLSSKYCQKLLDSAKKFSTDAKKKQHRKKQFKKERKQLVI